MNEKIKEVLALLENFNLYSYERSDGPYAGDDTEALENLLSEKGYSRKAARVHCGMTKVCIVFSNWDYVVKMDRKGYHGCDTEVRVYSVAKQHRVEKAFLETRKIGENIHGTSIYIQPKVGVAFEDLPREAKEKWRRRTRNLSDDVLCKVKDGFYYSPAHLWVKVALLCYGKKFMRELEKVTQICFINDLHCGNIGFVKNKPVFLDYAGFHGSRWEETIHNKYYIEMR